MRFSKLRKFFKSGTSKSSATTRRSLATLGQAVEPPTCPESLATEVLTRRSLASLGHSLGENICPEDAAELLETIVSQEGLAKKDGPSEEAQCGFLSTILTACLKAIVRGRMSLTFRKARLTLLRKWCKMKPRTPWDLEDRFLNLALHAVLRLEEPCFDYVGQSLYRSSHQTLEVLLLGLLQEDSSSEHLFAILDHLQTGLRSQEDRERIWASGKITGLLRRAALLREYNIMGEGLGRYVAELGVLLMDPKRQVVRHAREGIYRLYELGLQQRGIDIREVESLWLQDPTLDWEMACYLNTVRMAKAQGTEAKVQRHLRRFRECGKQPIELRCLMAEKGSPPGQQHQAIQPSQSASLQPSIHQDHLCASLSTQEAADQASNIRPSSQASQPPGPSGSQSVFPPGSPPGQQHQAIQPCQSASLQPANQPQGPSSCQPVFPPESPPGQQHQAIQPSQSPSPQTASLQDHLDAGLCSHKAAHQASNIRPSSQASLLPCSLASLQDHLRCQDHLCSSSPGQQHQAIQPNQSASMQPASQPPGPSLCQSVFPPDSPPGQQHQAIQPSQSPSLQPASLQDHLDAGLCSHQAAHQASNIRPSSQASQPPGPSRQPTRPATSGHPAKPVCFPAASQPPGPSGCRSVFPQSSHQAAHQASNIRPSSQASLPPYRQTASRTIWMPVCVPTRQPTRPATSVHTAMPVSLQDHLVASLSSHQASNIRPSSQASLLPCSHLASLQDHLCASLSFHQTAHQASDIRPSSQASLPLYSQPASRTIWVPVCLPTRQLTRPATSGHPGQQHQAIQDHPSLSSRSPGQQHQPASQPPGPSGCRSVFPPGSPPGQQHQAIQPSHSPSLQPASLQDHLGAGLSSHQATHQASNIRPSSQASQPPGPSRCQSLFSPGQQHQAIQPNQSASMQPASQPPGPYLRQSVFPPDSPPGQQHQAIQPSQSPSLQTDSLQDHLGTSLSSHQAVHQASNIRPSSQASQPPGPSSCQSLFSPGQQHQAIQPNQTAHQAKNTRSSSQASLVPCSQPASRTIWVPGLVCLPPGHPGSSPGQQHQAIQPSQSVSLQPASQPPGPSSCQPVFPPGSPPGQQHQAIQPNQSASLQPASQPPGPSLCQSVFPPGSPPGQQYQAIQPASQPPGPYLRQSVFPPGSPPGQQYQAIQPNQSPSLQPASLHSSLGLLYLQCFWELNFEERKCLVAARGSALLILAFHFVLRGLQSVSALLEKFKKSDQLFDIDAEAASDPGDPALEDDFDADALDKTVARDLGEFSEKLEPCRIAPASSRKDVVPLGDGDIGSLCLHLFMNPHEYSHFSPRIMSMWAGPEHWHFKPHHKGDANPEKASRRKAAKKAFELHFEEEIDFDSFFRKTRAAMTLSKSTLESQNKKSTTLPADFHYDPDKLTRLLLKPTHWLLKAPLQSGSPSLEDEVGEYDYNNPNDTSNFCPALQYLDQDRNA
ncbi:hypothetical protein JRQ81_010976 [Phrynocephalus forsythii]|uniref:Condensin complex subunit 2 n=1 Tax=Phrynocephalus forsythii TaxID=171643 RepID=A0A9Q1AQY0_9SAUR|nr:hypothetical protein JRQ81_010976 [Phrynocephalus forsythii]